MTGGSSSGSPSPIRRAPPSYESIRQSPEKSGKLQGGYTGSASNFGSAGSAASSISSIGGFTASTAIGAGIGYPPSTGPTLAFHSGISGDQFDKLASTVSRTRNSEDNNMSQTTQGKNIFLDVLNNHGDTLQQMALLAYLSKGEQAKPFLQATTAAKVCQTVYKHFSKTDEIDAARSETIQRITVYVKDHPRARPAEIQSKVEEEIALFKLKLMALGV